MSDYRQQQELQELQELEELERKFQELWIETQWDEAIKLNQQITENKNGTI